MHRRRRRRAAEPNPFAAPREARRPSAPADRRPATCDTAAAGSRSSSSNSSSTVRARGEAGAWSRRAEPHRRVAVLDRPVRRAGRRHRAHPRRADAGAGRGPGRRRAQVLRAAAQRHGRRGVHRLAGPRDDPRPARHDPESPTSIAAARRPRERARRARETLSTDIWAAINTTWRGSAPRGSMRGRRTISTGCAPHGDDRRHRGGDDDSRRELAVLHARRSIERADMTARLLSTAALAPGPDRLAHDAAACGAYEAFVRTYRGVEADRSRRVPAAGPLFPRSVVSSLVDARAVAGQARPSRGRARASPSRRCACSGALAPSSSTGRSPTSSSTSRSRWNGCQRTCTAATDAVSSATSPTHDLSGGRAVSS